MNILIVTYNWPPRNTIGTHRPFSWAKYWSRAGASVTVLTARKLFFDAPLDLDVPDLPGVEVHEAAFLRFLDRPRAAGATGQGGSRPAPRSLRSLKACIAGATGLAVDPRAWWVRPAVKLGLDLVRTRRFDAIVSSFGPRACHLVAHRLATACPSATWVADYRDLWIGNPLAPLRGARLRRESRLETHTVGARANLLTTVSEGLAKSLRTRFRQPVAVVLNGHDVVAKPGSPGAEPAVHAGPDLRLVHTGSLYGGTRDPSPLFRAARSWCERGAGARRPRIAFYGSRCEGLDALVRQCGVEDLVLRGGHVSHAESLRHQREADALVLLESHSPAHEGVLTGKVFEYVASGRPVLCVGPAAGSEIDRLLRSCGVGIAVGIDEALIERALGDLAAAGGPAWFRPDRDAIAALSREAQARRMLGLLEEARRCRQAA